MSASSDAPADAASVHPGALIPRGGGAVTQHPWPADCAVQAGLRGLVVSRNPDKPSYTTAFFEAFPRDLDTFLRGEGASVEEAEDKAWAQHLRNVGCPGHDYEPRGYRNGAGICRHCGLFSSGVFDLAEIGSVCVVCGIGTYWANVGGVLYCEEHEPRRPCARCGLPVSRTESILHDCRAGSDGPAGDEAAEAALVEVLARLAEAARAEE